ncbi:MAG: UDP-N-acetylglucosamine 2-epimerase (non-hydrolyzing) [Verrucomicrobia bacterium TMED56]|nr:MAG: UDP-N-acetylglucosamine 2-epimerase (non-hydrolyzing) [Verrucomicrobia bacterium TMED56]|tara:strand:+ start:244 stop:1386 length:1143 start_codon:yes stop_codon:yes gene_type:complete
MTKKKIMLVFGTRPEAIKMAPLIHALKAEPDNFELKVCVTSQHREMLDQVLKIFNIKPDIDLNLMKKDQNLLNLTSLILDEMGKVLKEYKPEMVLVHGDTTTTLATSIAAFYLSIPVGHIEAGLRTYNLNAPFPEEFNRQITGKITKLHFTPTVLGQKNLLTEGIKKSSIIVTGNTVIDAVHWILKRIDSDEHRQKNINDFLNIILLFDWKNENFVLVTAHRRENFGNGFIEICSALKQLALKYPKIHFVYPVHPNPNVIKIVYETLQEINNIHLIKPLEYEPFVYLLKKSYIVLTDSGGIQEEAPSLSKPVLVMRDTTERPEAVEAGTVEIVGTNHQQIINGISRLLEDNKHYQTMSRAHNPYGDGLACKRIIDVLRTI